MGNEISVLDGLGMWRIGRSGCARDLYGPLKESYYGPMEDSQMSTSRDAMLQRARQAVAEGNRAGAAPPLPARGNVGYQGAGSDLVSRFMAELKAAGGHAHLAPNSTVGTQTVLGFVQAASARRVLLGRGSVLDGLSLATLLQQRSVETQVIDGLDQTFSKQAFFSSDLGISGVAWAIAETGTLVMASKPSDPRSLSLLPPLHIAVVGQSQLLPDLFDLFAELEVEKNRLPSCLSLITGPSKTGDIELKLVTGVHGPRELHVVVIEGM
jgi:L-lactate utilization protein LutC